jgi:hypothetical protein
MFRKARSHQKKKWRITEAKSHGKNIGRTKMEQNDVIIDNENHTRKGTQTKENPITSTQARHSISEQTKRAPDTRTV